MKALVMETIGTMFLFLAIGICVLTVELSPVAPYAISGMLMLMIYAGGAISGAHYNPMVSLGAAIRGAFSWKLFLPYNVAQLLGVALSLLPLSQLVSHDSQAATNVLASQVFIAEFIFSFMLCFTILMVATNEKTAGNSYFGFAIGLCVFVGANLIGGISGAALNPAVAIGLVAIGKISQSMIGVYLLAEFLGGITAGFLCKLLLSEKSVA